MKRQKLRKTNNIADIKQENERQNQKIFNHGKTLT